MRDHPLILQGWGVRATLEGRKTQTRRVIKPQPVYEGKRSYGDSWAWRHGKDWFSGATTDQLVGKLGLLFAGRCPYGQPGDLLWVREAFAYIWGARLYKADGATEYNGYPIRWHPSIHMPRHCSRLMLRITEVRVQRLQEITEKDARAEGVEYGNVAGVDVDIDGDVWNGAYRRAFALLWDFINAKRGYSWEYNPWVWAISYERVAS